MLNGYSFDWEEELGYGILGPETEARVGRLRNLVLQCQMRQRRRNRQILVIAIAFGAFVVIAFLVNPFSLELRFVSKISTGAIALGLAFWSFVDPGSAKININEAHAIAGTLLPGEVVVKMERDADPGLDVQRFVPLIGAFALFLVILLEAILL